MAATESRTGFRLPWSTEDKATDQPADASQDADRPADAEATDAHAADEAPTAAVAVTEPSEAQSESVAPSPAEPPADDGHHEEASVHPTASPASTPRPADGAPKKPTKFLADLTRAMQAAAESSRASTMEQFQGEAKAHIEEVHARSADEATELRKSADEDIVEIRDWSKAELARIREETDRKITQRKADLDVELEEHAARIEQKIELVQKRVATFEAEMDRFFERLLTEDDPAEFAAMAENLPEPPPFDFDLDADLPVHAAAVETPAPGPVAAIAVAEAAPAAAEAATSDAETTEPAPTAEAGTEPVADGGSVIGQAEGTDEGFAVQDDPAAVEAAMKAIEAAYKAAEDGSRTDAKAEPATESDDAASSPSDEPDPRLAALGLEPDLGAAEAEAAEAAAATTDDEIPTIDDDALAARLAGLVPEGGSAPAPRAPAPKAAATSQVVVTGLVSVASIASFKRHLGRLAGVQSVGVSSGPDGEFVFKVAHGADVSLADAIPSLPGFEARVTGTGDGVVNVSARDPESEA